MILNLSDAEFAVFFFMKTYSEKLRSPKWQKKRLEILKRDKFKCTMCADSETELQVHHLKYTGEPWDAPNENLTTLCKHCHVIVEDAKKKDINLSSIVTGEYYKIGKYDFGVMFYSLDGLEKPEFLIGFRYNSIALKHLYKLSIKK